LRGKEGGDRWKKKGFLSQVRKKRLSIAFCLVKSGRKNIRHPSTKCWGRFGFEKWGILWFGRDAVGVHKHLQKTLLGEEEKGAGVGYPLIHSETGECFGSEKRDRGRHDSGRGEGTTSADLSL